MLDDGKCISQLRGVRPFFSKNMLCAACNSNTNATAKLSAIEISIVAFTMDTYVHSMNEHKRNEMNKMDDMLGVRYNISVENQPYPVLCTITVNGCTAHTPDFPKIEIHTPTLDAALLEVKQQIQKALHQYKYPPIPTRQEQIVVPDNSVLVLVKAG